ncbi:hypothetical protein [Sphingomonas sp.]|uniref:hypothetical protein n=1 Tax=Sphingomonas sp. TaxID=28214 RepID=UPI001EC5222A|nr:hypothetical protein [Sphingomonas sp.]MBX3594437.1 hypothetical protein [Sphingomonas sp.]
MRNAFLLAVPAVLAACSGEPALKDPTQNNSVAAEPLGMPDAGQPAPPSSATPAPVAEIPEAFRGEWNRVAADCGTDRNASRLRVEAGSLRFYESSGTVEDVAGKGRTITVRARYSGEGQTEERTTRFSLSQDGKTLRSEGMDRVRCR